MRNIFISIDLPIVLFSIWIDNSIIFHCFVEFNINILIFVFYFIFWILVNFYA